MTGAPVHPLARDVAQLAGPDLLPLALTAIRRGYQLQLVADMLASARRRANLDPELGAVAAFEAELRMADRKELQAWNA